MARFPNARTFLKVALKMLLDDKIVNTPYQFVKFCEYVQGQSIFYTSKQDVQDFKFINDLLLETYTSCCSETLKTQFGYPQPTPEMDSSVPKEITIWEPMDIDVEEFDFFFKAFEEDHLVKDTSIKPIDLSKV
ncbi:MAG: hypothetical protein RLY11_1322 [Bacteroidota bacterium]|jgi:hypothetical protein